MIKQKTPIQRFFNDFSSHYNQSAFYDSMGLDYLNKIETDFIRTSTAKKRVKRLLEIGFGAGRNLEIFKDRGIELHGVDISEKMVGETKRRLRGEKITLAHLDAEDGLPFTDESFDLVMCIRVLKYMKRWRFVLSEISRTLKSGGVAILEVPNLFSIHFFGLVWANYFLFNIFDFQNELNKNGLKIVRVKKGALSPFLLYKFANTPTLLKILTTVDGLMNSLLPVGVLSRNYTYFLQKN